VLESPLGVVNAENDRRRDERRDNPSRNDRNKDSSRVLVTSV